MRPLAALTLSILAVLGGSAIAKALDKGTHFAILVGCGIFGVFAVTLAWASAEPREDPEEEQEYEGRETKKDMRKREREVRRMLIKECWPKKNAKLGRVREEDVKIEYN
jgi:hypothetical protein